MKLTNEFQPIRDWADAKGILSKGDSKTQTLKTLEELGELAKAILEKNPAEIEDAIGDVVVTLVCVANFNGLTIEQCINSAYWVIANRVGKMENGTFIRDKSPELPFNKDLCSHNLNWDDCPDCRH